MKKVPQILYVDIIVMIILWLVLILSSGCMTGKKVSRFLTKNETFSNEWFSNHYGFLDSVGIPEVTYRPAANKDYSGQIDSLSNLIDAQMEAVKRKKETADSACKTDLSDVHHSYNTLLSKYRILQQSYIPCIPDTVFVEIPHYMSSKADKARITDLEKKSAALKAGQKADKNEIKLWKSRLYMGLAILVLLIGAGFLLKRLNILKLF